ncbi:AAA family ATPase [Ningiella sp. W23]|uniref:AAA family ATPase n=1 Tax=Ningiella sp. W23 TaxID=3023715 RepID=UPI00375748C6
MPKELNIIVGGNGSGKSTFYYRFLAKRGLPFLNADELAKEKWPDDPEQHSYEAASEIEEKRKLFLANGLSFCFETVFSHVSKVDFIGLAKAYGYSINLFVIHIGSDPSVNIARIKNRKKHGGHTVPDTKVTERIPRMLKNVTRAVPICDSVSFFDNSSALHPFSRVAVLMPDRTLHQMPLLPKWVHDCIGMHYTQVDFFD